MMTRFIFIVFSLMVLQSSVAQSSHKITGPLGVYHIAQGNTYSDSAATDSIPLQWAFRFGEPAIPNQAFDDGTFSFPAELDSCAAWHVNRLFAIIQPPTEHGVSEQPGDTALYEPWPQSDGPGMVQGGQRFSRLSQIYGGISGVILDDWDHDTATTRQVRDAVLGKYVDASGVVHSDCASATPYNKLFSVIYGTAAVPDALPVIDGVCYAYFTDQNCCYMQLDSDISTIRTNFPGKEIMIAIYLKNTALGWTDPASVHYLLAHALDSYDAGYIGGITLFAGSFLLTSQIPDSDWTQLALPHWLDSLYYPYLGQGQGAVYDCDGAAASGAAVRVFCTGRLSGDTFMRSYQLTGASGLYGFGAWAGSGQTDSVHYRLIAEKPGYISDTVDTWIRRGDTTFIPDLIVCPGINGTAGKILAYPNPATRWLTVEVGIENIGEQLNVFNMQGRRVYSATLDSAISGVDLSGMPDGIYEVVLASGQDSQVAGRQRIAVMR